ADIITDEDQHPTIPRSDTAEAYDDRIDRIRTFLNTQIRPDNFTDLDFQTFINEATKYFVLDEKLWRRHSHGRHQVVIPRNRRYELMRSAHDDLGHKGV